MLTSAFVYVVFCLCGHFVSWFLFPLWNVEEYDGCVLPDRKFSVDLIGMATGSCNYKVFPGIGS